MYKLNGEDILKIYKLSLFILIIMIFSVGFAFAEDANQTDSDLGVTDGEVISDGQVKSYAELDTDLHKLKIMMIYLKVSVMKKQI